MSDNAVPPDYVGVKSRRHTYRFEYQKRGASVVVGSAKWIGPSVNDHPDFAWYPLTAVAENPEIDVKVVRQITQAETGSLSPTQPDANPDPDQPRPAVLSPVELVGLIANRTSAFDFDFTVDRFDGGFYQPGERYTVRGVSEKSGYLYLLHIDPKGNLSMLFPKTDKPQPVSKGRTFVVPGQKSKAVFRAALPAGGHRVKAVVTTRPLVISGQLPDQSFRGSPSQRQAVQQLLRQHVKGELKTGALSWTKIKPLLGEFAQDEIRFAVQPAQAEPQEKPKPA